jgi:hypothetical protein
VESIRNGILSMVADPDLRESVVKSGEQNVKRFDPLAVSAQYAALYDEILPNIKAESEN